MGCLFSSRSSSSKWLASRQFLRSLDHLNLPRPSLPGRGLSNCRQPALVTLFQSYYIKNDEAALWTLTIVSSPYRCCSCLTTSCVPSGLLSSTIIISCFIKLRKNPSPVSFEAETLQRYLLKGLSLMSISDPFKPPTIDERVLRACHEVA